VHPRMSENLFRRYLREREKHPGHECACLAREISMLHGKVLMLLRLFVIASRAVVLGIGAHRRGDHRAWGDCKGVQEEVCNQHRTRRRAQLTPSADIFSDLVRNVKDAGISEHIQKSGERLGNNPIGCP